ncbi:ethanolamine ammonia-lyase reactivating factor EutA [Bacillus sp. OTU530]|uniref:ethanolamine ammonia-lyase reactivating factor EutA n=1 Tax=Bacillus sp. OTU530 TaxID=3043862 RepID=UPI00313D37F7
MVEDNWITSIGLDIGTSTTKFIVSQLLVQQTGDRFSLPGCQITDRRIVYTSRIYTTPLKNDYEIDMNALAELLAYEYEQSQTSLQHVKAGAVIITGETARKENAQTIIHYLAERAGDFVVATAGASLEGILAGKGSGAMMRSQHISSVVANVDIGGGTANVALFQQGKAVQTVTFHVGGRLIRLTGNGEVLYISKQIQPWLQANGFHIQTGGMVTYKQLEQLCCRMNESLLSYLTGASAHHAELLLLEPPAAPLPPVDEIIFSGGVGQMMLKRQPQFMEEVTVHGDMGPLLASTLRTVSQKYPVRIQDAAETTRATVIGAGMQNTEVSGATVYINESLLPIKNVPIINIPVEEDGQWRINSFHMRLRDAMLQTKQLFDTEQDPPCAVALSSISYCTYAMLQSLADLLHHEFMTHFPEAACMVVICETDMAKALGQALAKRCKKHPEVICIDQVDFTHGDYIDLGLPVAGEAISVSVKTLAFL